MNTIQNIYQIENLTSKDLAKEWNYMETLGMETFIHTFFKGMELKNHEGQTLKSWSKKGIEDIFGLPYTSSSCCAMLVADCNNHIFINENEHISYFALKNGTPIMITENNKEKEKFYGMELE